MNAQQKWINKIPLNFKRIFTSKISCSSCNNDKNEKIKLAKIKHILISELKRGIFKSKRINGIPPCILYSLNNYPIIQLNSEDDKPKFEKEYINIKNVLKQGKEKFIKCADLISDFSKNRDKTYYKEIQRNQFNIRNLCLIKGQHSSSCSQKINFNKNSEINIINKNKEVGEIRDLSPDVKKHMTSLEKYYFRFGVITHNGDIIKK